MKHRDSHDPKYLMLKSIFENFTQERYPLPFCLFIYFIYFGKATFQYFVYLVMNSNYEPRLFYK